MNILADLETNPRYAGLVHHDRHERQEPHPMTTPAPESKPPMTSLPPAAKETHMQARAASFAGAASRIAAAASNRLLVELAEHDLGSMLGPQEINVVCTLVDSLERPRRERLYEARDMNAGEMQPPADDGTGQQAT